MTTNSGHGVGAKKRASRPAMSSSSMTIKSSGTAVAYGTSSKNTRAGNLPSSHESDRITSQARTQNLLKAEGIKQIEDKNAEDNKQGDIGDDVNIKRSIEMKNGIALRSMNNFHKGTNAISLNNYKVSKQLGHDLNIGSSFS